MIIPKEYLDKRVSILLKGEEVSVRGYIDKIEEEYILIRKNRAKNGELQTFIPLSSILAIKPNENPSGEEILF